MLLIPQSKRTRYILWGALLWFIVDFGTAGGFNVYYLIRNPHIVLFIIGYPLIFAYLIFSRNWNGKKLFGATVAAMFAIEGVLTRNPFVLAFPLLTLGIPLAVCIYAVLTYSPLWIVNGELGKHRRIVIALSAVVAIIIMLSVITNR